jgi:alpha-D-xyloside xylohydrolase
MAESLRGGLSLAASGFGYWSHDIGGFEGTPDAAVFKRWLAFGLLSSHSRLHGSSSYRVPWAFDDEAVEVTRRFTHLKHRLMPYLAQAGEEAHADGVPVMRPMVLEFPDDPGAQTVDTQYLLGPDLLVAPVFSASGDVDVYVPEGTWTSLLDGSQVTGPRWVHQVHGFESVPVYQRPGSVLPLGARTDRPDYDWADGVTLRVAEPVDGARVVVGVPAPDGGEPAEFVVTREGARLTVEARGARGEWGVEVVGGPAARAAAGGTALVVDL